MLRLETRVAINRIPEDRIEAGPEPFVQRGRTVPSAHMRPQFGAAAAKEPGDGAVARVCRRGRREGDPLIRGRGGRQERRRVQQEELRTKRAADLQTIAEQPRLVLHENRVAELGGIGRRRRRGIAGIGVVVRVILALELIAAAQHIVRA